MLLLRPLHGVSALSILYCLATTLLYCKALCCTGYLYWHVVDGPRLAIVKCCVGFRVVVRVDLLSGDVSAVEVGAGVTAIRLAPLGKKTAANTCPYSSEVYHLPRQ